MTFRTRAERRMDADLAAYDFARKIAQAKAPNTWRLKEEIEDAIRVLPAGPKRDELERVAISLAWDAEVGAEQGANNVEYVEELLAAVRGK